MVDGPNVYEYGLLNPATYADRDGRIVTVLVGLLAALLAGCGLYSFIGADNGPQGDSTQHLSSAASWASVWVTSVITVTLLD